MKLNDNLIYIIDDDNIFRFILKKQLSKINPDLTIVEYNNGSLAYKDLCNAIKLHGTLAKYFFIDVNMPIMNGWDFLNTISNQYSSDLSNINFYLITSSLLVSDYYKSLHHPLIKKIILKPVEQEELESIFNTK